MSWIKGARPSPAIVVAVLALIAALAGTAVAGSGPTATGSGTKKKAKRALRLAKQNKEAIKTSS